MGVSFDIKKACRRPYKLTSLDLIHIIHPQVVLESTLARIGDVSAALAGGTAVGGQQAAANWAHQQAVFLIRVRLDLSYRN